MNIKKFVKDSRAVSPVIGVILMVAITVILAAVIGTFVLGLGDQVSESAPQAQFTFEYDQDATTVSATHDGGDSIEESQISIAESDSTNTISKATDDGTYTAGDFVINGETYDSGETIRIVWTSGESSKSATISRSTAP